MTITGECHCGNLSFELSTLIAPETIRPRACDCRFCRIHGAANWSDPAGSVTIEVGDAAALQKYRFGLRTADFYICRTCGAYLGAVLSAADEVRSTVNLRLTMLQTSAAAVGYGGEDAAARIARRMRLWTPTRIRIGDVRAPC